MQDDDPERSAHTRWYSNDLDAKLDDWAEKSKHAKADLIERALKDFFDRYRINSGGHITLKDENRPQNVSTDDEMLEQVLENQGEILAALNTPHPQDDADGQKINSRSSPSGEASKEADADSDEGDDEPVNNLRAVPNKLFGEWDHDETISPDDIDHNELKQTPDHAVPAMTGVINYLREEEEVEKMSRKELVGELADALRYSETGVRDNYLPKLERAGVIRPHPSIDDSVDVSDEIPEAVPLDEDGKSQFWSEMMSNDKRRYHEDIGVYLEELGVDWSDDVYYLSDELWERDVRRILSDGYGLLQSSHSTRRKRRGLMTDMEVVNAYRQLLIDVWEVYRGVAVDVDEIDIDDVHGEAVGDAVDNFAGLTGVEMRGRDAMEDERRVIEHILF